LIRNRSAGTGFFHMKPIKEGGWVFGWSEPEQREVRKTIADHARDV